MSPAPHQNGTESDATAQEVPEVIRELQAARETRWLDRLEITGGRFDRASMLTEVMALAAEETFEATSALRQELAQTKAALARVRALADAFADDGLARYGGNIAWHIEEAIANEKGDFPDAADQRIASQRERSEAAEAELVALRAAIEALADEYAASAKSREDNQIDEQGRLWGVEEITRVAPVLRTVEADVRAVLAAESTPAVEPHAEDGARRQIDPQSAADALEAAVHMVDDDDAAEVLAKMADQWRAEAKSAAEGNEGRPSATWPFKHNLFTRDVKPKGECPACDYRPAPVADPDDTKDGPS